MYIYVNYNIFINDFFTCISLMGKKKAAMLRKVLGARPHDAKNVYCGGAVSRRKSSG
jgi:hypothetical protein